MATTTITLNKPTIMTQQIQTHAKKGNRSFNEDECWNDPKFRELFPVLTDEQFDQELEKGLQSAREGRTMSAEESVRRIREEVGI